MFLETIKIGEELSDKTVFQKVKYQKFFLTLKSR